MSLPELIGIAATTTSATIAKIESPDLDAPTTCSRFTFRELANHLTGFLPYSANAARRGPALDGGPADFAADPSWASTFAELASDAAAAWSEPQALDGTVQFGPGEFPAEAAAGITLLELTVHGWDLARSVGLDYDVDPAVAQAVAGIASGIDNATAPDGAFAPPVDVSDDVEPFLAALAKTGRDPFQTVTSG